MAYAALNPNEVGLSKVVLDKYTPATWTDKSLENVPQLIELSQSSQEYTDVFNKISATMLINTVSTIQRVQNPYLWGAYLLKKAENPDLQELTLFHATVQSDVTSIVNDNYDWRGTEPFLFGKGVRFYLSADSADTMFSKTAGKQRAMIVNRVLVNRKKVGSRNTKFPEEEYVTASGFVWNVSVKYDDNMFYPEYVAYYSSSRVGGSPIFYSHDHRRFFNDDYLEDSD